VEGLHSAFGAIFKWPW